MFLRVIPHLACSNMCRIYGDVAQCQKYKQGCLKQQPFSVFFFMSVGLYIRPSVCLTYQPGSLKRNFVLYVSVGRSVCLSVCLFCDCPSVGMSFCLGVCVYVCPSVRMFVGLPVCSYVGMSACLISACLISACLPVCPSDSLHACLYVCPSVGQSVCLSVCPLEPRSRRDFLTSCRKRMTPAPRRILIAYTCSNNKQRPAVVRLTLDIGSLID